MTIHINSDEVSGTYYYDRIKIPITLKDTFNPEQVVVIGDIAYLADNFQGLSLVDFSNPVQPKGYSSENDWVVDLEPVGSSMYYLHYGIHEIRRSGNT